MDADGAQAPRGRRRDLGKERAWRIGSGVDVGGTFTDLFLVDDGDHRQWRVKTPSTPSDPSQGVLTGVARICEAAGIAPARPRQRRPRHDRRDQRRARVQGRPRRADHHAGLRPDPAPRALADARAAGRLDHHGQARPAGVAGRHARGGRADGRAREHARPRRPRRRSRAIIDDLVDSGVESLTDQPDQLLRRRRATSRRSPTSSSELHPGFPVTISSRRAARVPRVRAHADRLHELLRAPAGGVVRRPPAVRAVATSA